MVVFKREPAVERVIDFISKFSTSFCKKTEEKDEEDGDQEEKEEVDSVADNKLLQHMFDFLLDVRALLQFLLLSVKQNLMHNLMCISSVCYKK